MNWEYNDKRNDNKDIIDVLVSQEGYVDLGWAACLWFPVWIIMIILATIEGYKKMNE
jgi:hypothetical protein